MLFRLMKFYWVNTTTMKEGEKNHFNCFQKFKKYFGKPCLQRRFIQKFWRECIRKNCHGFFQFLFNFKRFSASNPQNNCNHSLTSQWTDFRLFISYIGHWPEIVNWKLIVFLTSYDNLLSTNHLTFIFRTWDLKIK